MTETVKLRLGGILIEQKLLTEGQLQICLVDQQRSGKIGRAHV